MTLSTPTSGIFRLAALLGALCIVAVASEDIHAQSTGAHDRATSVVPMEARGVTVEERFGVTIDRAAPFIDHSGARVTLGDYFKDDRPVLLTFNWYNCKTLCSVQLNHLLETFRAMEWTAGKDGFRVVTLSIDPREDWTLARDKRDSYLRELGRGDVDWNFLVADPDRGTNVRQLAESMGFFYRYDAMQDQYVHAAAVYVLTPQAVISHYLLGIVFEPRDVRFSLIEASNGKLGTSFDKMLLINCFHYDANLGRYAATGMDIMRFFGFLIMFVFGSILLVFWLTDRSTRRHDATLEAEV